MVIRKLVVAAAVAIGVAAAAASASAAWDGDSKAMTVTFSGAVGLPGVTLGSGTYVFEVIDLFLSADIVRVRSKERSTIYYTGITVRVDRPTDLAENRAVVLGEAAAGVAPPIRAWYPVGAAFGHQFIYNNR